MNIDIPSSETLMQELSTLCEHLQDGLAYCRMIFDNNLPVDFIYLYTNPAFDKYFCNSSIAGHLSSESRNALRNVNFNLLETYARIVKTGKPEIFEIFLAAEERWFSVSVYSPKPDHVVSIFNDVTKIKSANTRLRDALSQARHFREVLDNVPAYIYI